MERKHEILYKSVILQRNFSTNIPQPPNMYAPIIIFAFNRETSLKGTIQSLLQNSEASESDLFIYVDGPRIIKQGEAKKVESVRKYVQTITGFKSVTHVFSEKNKGLAASVIQGVSEVICQYGRAIVVEDDLVVTPNFLSFMNQGLERYEDENRVFSICGYSNKVKVPAGYLADSYLCTRSSSWGWGTWKDRWESVDWDLRDWNTCRKHSKEFNRWGGSDCWKMLNDWHEGRNQSWAIRFCFAQFLQDKTALFPVKSLVQNDGFNGEGTNCKKWNRFRSEPDRSGKKVFTWPDDTMMNLHLWKQAKSYHGLCIRIWSRLMYLIYR